MATRAGELMNEGADRKAFHVEARRGRLRYDHGASCR